MKKLRMLVILLLVVMVSACTGKEPKETCTITKYAKESIVIRYGFEKEIDRLELTATIKTDKEGAEAIDDTFENLYGGMNGVEIDSEYDDGLYSISIKIEMEEVSDENIKIILDNLNVTESKDTYKLIEQLEELGYDC